MRTQSGFTTFTVTLILVLILLAVSLLVGKLLVADRRVALNEALYRQAMALAEQGLSDGVGRVSSDSAWRGNLTLSPSGAGGSYILSVQDAVAVTVGGASITPISISSNATLDNGQAAAVVRAQYVLTNVLASSPAAPFVVAGSMAVGGNFTVVANPNGGGPGVPLSIWSGGVIDLTHGSGQTCNQGDYNGGCSASISQAGDKESDIKDSDPAFPTDLVRYLFNENDDTGGWANLESIASQIVTSCAGLGPTSTGLIIVKGDCSPSANIGTQAAPVVLIVKDGSLSMNGNGQLNGVVFAYSSHPATATTNVKLNGGALVNGVLVANYDVGKSNGTFDAKYDGSVLSNIKSGAAFQILKQIPGSWRDW